MQNIKDQLYQNFEKEVLLKYQISNGLFLALPFSSLNQAGSKLSIFAKYCEDGLQQGLEPLAIIENYFTKEHIPSDNQLGLLFQFLQFIERQVVLCDALEDSAFTQTHDLYGVNTLEYLLRQVEINSKQTKLNKILESYKLRLVLTAHPTQFYPKQILWIIHNLTNAIDARNIPKLRQLFLQLGLTRFTNKTKPTPIDEAKSLVWYLENVFYPNLPLIQKKLTQKHINFELGFWPGGDRDGNPYVVAATTLQVAKIMQDVILKLYHNDLRTLRNWLTFEKTYEMVNQIIYKLYEYPNSCELINDLNLVIQVLKDDYQGLFVELVEDLILKVRMFDFHFAKLDIRQNSAIHKLALSQIFNEHKLCDDYSKLSSQDQLNLLNQNWNNLKLLNSTSTDAKELIDTVRAIYTIKMQRSAQSIERYIISNCDSIVSIYETLFIVNLVRHELILKHPEIANIHGLFQLEIVPLFEMIDDLKNSITIMEYLYNDEKYLAHLKVHNNRQTIMLGFSDGTKDGGYFKANWSIYLAKKNLSILAHKYGIDLVFFDGRGGSPSRGGGDSYDFYHALGKNTDNKEIQLTIQGQTISSNFGTKDSAIFNTQNLFSAGLNAKLFPAQEDNLDPNEEDIIEQLSDLCYSKYEELKQDPLFIDYLEEITPLKYLSQLNVGSRPTKRGGASKLRFSDLRAIPFVGSWMQIEQNILGFYGVGSAISELNQQNPEYIKTLHKLYNQSLFFRTLINNAIQSVATTNFQLTGYLATDSKFAKFWQKLKMEKELSEEMLKQVLGDQEPSSIDRAKLASISLRRQIVLPLIIIQQYAMSKLRDPNCQNKEILEKLVVKSIPTHINASRNAV